MFVFSEKEEEAWGDLIHNGVLKMVKATASVSSPKPNKNNKNAQKQKASKKTTTKDDATNAMSIKSEESGFPLNGGPITVAVLLLLNGDLESPTLPREMRLQDLLIDVKKGKNLGTRAQSQNRKEDNKRKEDDDEEDSKLEEELDNVPEEQTIVIGRNNTNTYVLDVPDLPYLLSRTHAKCVSAGDEHFIYDFKTTNGTYVNGKMIEKQKYVKLMHGDIVSFGGPANVLRNEKSMKNPFRFRYLRTKVARESGAVLRASQQQKQHELSRQNAANNDASGTSGAVSGKRDHGVAGNAAVAGARGGNVGKKLKMSTFPLVGKGVDAQPLTLGGGYDDEFVPIFSQGPSQEIDDYVTNVHSQNHDGTGDHEKIREMFEEGLLQLFQARGGEFARKFNSAFMNFPIKEDEKGVVGKDVVEGNGNGGGDAGVVGEKREGEDAKMESADESPEDDSRRKKNKKGAKMAAAAANDDDFTQPVGGGGDNISDGSNGDHDMETGDHEKKSNLDVQLIAKLSQACANRIVPTEDAQHEMPPWIEHELRCPVCREFLVRPHCVQGCGHVFCFGCIHPWLAKSKPCPLCRHKPAVCLPPKIDHIEAARSFEMIGPKMYAVKQQLTPCHVHEKLLKMYVLKWLTPAQKLKRLNFEEEGKRVEKLMEERELKRMKQEQEYEASEVPDGAVGGSTDVMNELGLRAAFLRAYHMERAAQHLDFERRNSIAASLENAAAANINDASQERSAVRMQFEAAHLPSEEHVRDGDLNNSQQQHHQQEEEEEVKEAEGEEEDARMLERVQETAAEAREAARKTQEAGDNK